MTVRNLDRLLRPASVALIGATEREGSLGALLARNLAEGGFKGPVWFVTPTRREIFGRAAFASVDALPQAPDLAVIASPPASVPKVIADLGARGTRAAVIVTVLGRAAEAERLHAATCAAARPHGLRLVGPAGLGVVVPGRGLNASFLHLMPPAGDVAFIARSGAVAGALVDWAVPRGIGFSQLVSLGDMADVDDADILDYCAADADTRAILLYTEGMANARKFLSAARAAARAKPVIAIRSGRHRDMVDRDAVYDAVFRRAGVLRVPSLEELFAALEALAQRLPHDARPGWGDRIAVMANGSGIGALATDALVAEGGRLARLAPETLARLDRVLPADWSRGNPVDVLEDADGPRYEAALDALLADREVDAVLVLHGPAILVSPLRAADGTVAAVERHRAERFGGPWIFTSWLGEASAQAARGLFDQHHIPTFATPAEAIRAFTYLVRHRLSQDALMETPASIPAEFTADPAAARAVIAAALESGRDGLTPAETEAVLSAYGVPMGAQEASAAPLAFRLAAAEDPEFGPVLRFGLGGPVGRMAGRVVVGLPPLNATLARDLVEQLFRRQGLGPEAMPAEADRDALVRLLVQLAQIVSDLAEIVTLDVDPLCLASGHAWAGGARLHVAPARQPASARLAIPPYPRELEEEVRLPDGRGALLRPIRPEDEPALRALFARMSPEHVRLRFFQPLHRLSHDLAARLTQIDYDRQIALVLTTPGLPGVAEILGVGRLIRDPAGEAGEYALTVRTDLGGRGYGRFLMERLINYARRIGLKEVFGLVLSENEAMLALCRKLGFRLRPVVDDPSVIRVSLRLDAAEEPQAG